MSQERNNNIPYLKPARVGNFKVWRGRYTVKVDKEKQDIECINVSNLDGSWRVQIPSTMMMYATIADAFNTTDDNLREQFLGMVFTNMYNCSTCSSEALHDAFFFLVEMMTFPYLILPEKEMVKRMKGKMKALGYDKKKGDEHIAQMVEYRKGLYELIERKKARFLDEYERQMSERFDKEEESLEQLEQDELAEKAVDVLSEETKTEI